MPGIRKIIFTASITILVICLLVWIAGFFIPLEFTYAREEEIYHQVFFILPLIAVALTLAGTVKKHDTPAVVSSKVFLTFTVIAIFFLVAASNSLNQLCGYSNGKTLFVKKSDPGQKIVSRYFGCGATDSTPASVSVSRLKYYTAHFFIASPVDTTRIYLSEWRRVHE